MELAKYDYAKHGSKAAVIEGIAKRIKQRIQRASEDIIEIGTSLNEARPMFDGDGSFIDWLLSEFHEYELSQATAYRMMAVARTFGGKLTGNGSISKTALYLLSAPKVPVEAVDAAIEAANEGIDVTKPMAAEIVADAAADYQSDNSDDEQEQPQAETRNDDNRIRQPGGDSQMAGQQNNVAPIWSKAVWHLNEAHRIFDEHGQLCDERTAAMFAANKAIEAAEFYVRNVERID